MPNIKIMNNFQRYGPDGNEQPIFIPTTTTTVPQFDPVDYNNAINFGGIPSVGNFMPNNSFYLSSPIG
jgi:hypothetical protein